MEYVRLTSTIDLFFCWMELYVPAYVWMEEWQTMTPLTRDNIVQYLNMVAPPFIDHSFMSTVSACQAKADSFIHSFIHFITVFETSCLVRTLLPFAVIFILLVLHRCTFMWFCRRCRRYSIHIITLTISFVLLAEWLVHLSITIRFI